MLKWKKAGIALLIFGQSFFLVFAFKKIESFGTWLFFLAFLCLVGVIALETFVRTKEEKRSDKLMEELDEIGEERLLRRKIKNGIGSAVLEKINKGQPLDTIDEKLVLQFLRNDES